MKTLKAITILTLVGFGSSALACTDFSGNYLIKNTFQSMKSYAVITQDGCKSVIVDYRTSLDSSSDKNTIGLTFKDSSLPQERDLLGYTLRFDDYLIETAEGSFVGSKGKLAFIQYSKKISKLPNGNLKIDEVAKEFGAQDDFVNPTSEIWTKI